MPALLKWLRLSLMLKHNVSYIQIIVTLYNLFCLRCAVIKNTAQASTPFYFKPAFVVTSTLGIRNKRCIDPQKMLWECRYFLYIHASSIQGCQWVLALPKSSRITFLKLSACFSLECQTCSSSSSPGIQHWVLRHSTARGQKPENTQKLAPSFK